MATSTQLDLLAVIYNRSPEGIGVPEDELRAFGAQTYDDDVAVLERAGFVRVVRGDDADADAVAITDEGRAALGANPKA